MIGRRRLIRRRTLGSVPRQPAESHNAEAQPFFGALLEDFPDRFVVGTDQHYPEPLPGPQRWQAIVLLLNQLPNRLRQMIAGENAERLRAHGRLLPDPVLR